jgi:hypothetical protein
MRSRGKLVSTLAKVLWKASDEASDLKQRTARWKRAVLDQRPGENARILCFAKQSAFNQPVLGSSPRGLTYITNEKSSVLMVRVPKGSVPSLTKNQQVVDYLLTLLDQQGESFGSADPGRARGPAELRVHALR